jgi:hypothetical protein
MILRRVLLVFTVALLLAVSGVAGIVAADWPFWKRSLAIAQLKDGGEWPESFYQPVARIDGGGQGAFFPAAAPDEATIDPAALEAAAAWAEANNSAALLVLHDGRVQFERYWQGMSAEQLFSGRALSRSLVGLAFGFAVAEGRLALDDPAGKHLEEWRDDARGRITLRQLLQNISGLEEVPLTATVAPPGASWWQRADALRESYLGKNARLALGSDSAGVALSFGLTEPPGSRFAFSNPTNVSWRAGCGGRWVRASASSTWTARTACRRCTAAIAPRPATSCASARCWSMTGVSRGARCCRRAGWRASPRPPAPIRCTACRSGPARPRRGCGNTARVRASGSATARPIWPTTCSGWKAVAAARCGRFPPAAW